jgi:hypothetical protein
LNAKNILGSDGQYAPSDMTGYEKCTYEASVDWLSPGTSFFTKAKDVTKQLIPL